MGVFQGGAPQAPPPMSSPPKTSLWQVGLIQKTYNTEFEPYFLYMQEKMSQLLKWYYINFDPCFKNALHLSPKECKKSTKSN